MAKIHDVIENKKPAIDQNGDTTGQEVVGLLVIIDTNEDGRVFGTIELDFDDYAFLEAEWEAGLSTTVLQAAVTSVIGTATLPEDQMTEAQLTIKEIAFEL